MKPQERDQAGPHACGARRARWSTTWSRASPRASRVKLEINGVGYRAAVQGKEPEAAARLQPRRQVSRSRTASRSRAEKPTAIAITGADKQRVGQVAAEIRALSASPSPTRARACKYDGGDDPPQRRQEEVRRMAMSANPTISSQRRAGAYAAPPPQAADGRPRLSVFRSSQHIYAQVIDDARGVTLAAASTLDKDCARRRSRPAPTSRRADGGRQADRRARQGSRRQRRRVRPRRLYFSRPGQGPGRCRPRRRAGILRKATEHGTAQQSGERDRATRRRRPRAGGDREESEFVEKLVSINRVAKVVKGGRRFGFAALVVVGDGKGRVGYGSGKAREVPEAIRKATEQAKRGMIRVPLREGRTLHHDVDRPLRRRQGDRARGAAGYRHHRRRPDARRCSRRSACRTWWRSRSAPRIRTT